MEEKIQKTTNYDNISSEARKAILMALAEFNKWHNAEANAEIVAWGPSRIVVELTGPFCETCGFYDYLDDLKLELERELGRPLQIAALEERRRGCAIVYEIGGNDDG
ncbi:MAG: hypothetical protein NZ934_00930 [Hadesarchaea archaeon]|nr:hypothetical protein [Hadesarchaea archaeon]